MLMCAFNKVIGISFSMLYMLNFSLKFIIKRVCMSFFVVHILSSCCFKARFRVSFCSFYLPNALRDRDPFHVRHQIRDDKKKGEDFNDAVVESAAVAVCKIHNLLELAHRSTRRVIELKCAQQTTSPRRLFKMVDSCIKFVQNFNRRFVIGVRLIDL